MVRQLLLPLSMLALSTPAFAATMNWELEPSLPGHVPNPGGSMIASCWVDPEGTTPDFIRVTILDPSDVPVFQIELPGYTYWDLNWVAPDGLPDGVYHYLAEYYSIENGWEASGGEGFLLAGATRGICAFKFIDEDGDGALDDGESLAPGWEICFTYPDGSVRCELTDEDGAACIFFIPAGTYVVCETLQPGYEPTLPVCTDVIVTTTIEKAMFGNRLVRTGACCVGEECLVLSEEDCLAQGGTYYGDDFPCDPLLCVNTGACCIGEECFILTEEECLASGGEYQGDDVPCDPALCIEIRTGACCIDNECFILTEEECLAQGGEYQGDDVPCDDTICVPVPTFEKSWGAIKNIYR
jgi:hypothetical protein